jgi:hypothetical protein
LGHLARGLGEDCDGHASVWSAGGCYRTFACQARTNNSARVLSCLRYVKPLHPFKLPQCERASQSRRCWAGAVARLETWSLSRRGKKSARHKLLSRTALSMGRPATSSNGDATERAGVFVASIGTAGNDFRAGLSGTPLFTTSKFRRHLTTYSTTQNVNCIVILLIE